MKILNLGGNSIIKMPKNITVSESIVKYISSVPYIDLKNCQSVAGLFSGCASLKTIPQLDIENATTMKEMFSGCTSLETIPELNITSLLPGSSIDYAFDQCISLVNLNLINWFPYAININLKDSSHLSVLSIHNIISNAKIPGPGPGAKLILHPTVYAAWQASEYYTADVADAQTKSITIEEFTE